MPPQARAAIFAPYAALTGFEGQIASAQHYRCNRILLTEEEQQRISTLLCSVRKHDIISVTYFLNDPGTDGKGGLADGEYLELTGKVLDIIPAYQTLRIEHQNQWIDLSFEDISEIKKQRKQDSK